LAARMWAILSPGIWHVHMGLSYGLMHILWVRSYAWDCATTPEGKARRANAWALADFVHVLDHADFWLKPHERRRAMHAGSMFLLTLQYLASEAKRSNYTCWFIRPKHHYFEHLKDYKQTQSCGYPMGTWARHGQRGGGQHLRAGSKAWGDHLQPWSPLPDYDPL
jgi:hypothetical protein